MTAPRPARLSDADRVLVEGMALLAYADHRPDPADRALTISCLRDALRDCSLNVPEIAHIASVAREFIRVPGDSVFSVEFRARMALAEWHRRRFAEAWDRFRGAH